jgi:hypothetical protein
MNFSRFLTLLAACAVLLRAQTGTSSLRGVVSDPSSGLVPGAQVSATNTAGLTRTAQSDAKGIYSIPGLPAGAYTVRITAVGFSDAEQTVQITAGQAAQLNIEMALKTQAEEVTVASVANEAEVSTDPSSNADSLVMDQQEMDALPDDPDDLSADLQALAGPAAGPNGGQFFVDGFTGGRLPPKQSIREIRVNQNPFAAEYDHPGQGRIEIFSKPGAQDFHGSLLYQHSDSLWNSRYPFVAVKPPYQRRQWEAQMSAPAGKKTSLSLDFERRDINENAIVNAFILDPVLNPAPFTQGIVTPLTGIESNLKIDRQLTASHTLTARLGYARDTNDNNGVGNFNLSDRAYHQERIEKQLQLIETGIITQHVVNETRFRFRQQNTDQAGGKAAPVITVQDAFSSGGSSVGTSFDHQNRYELQNFTSWVNGPHTMRFGGILRTVQLNNQAMQNYTGTFTFTSLASYRATLIGIQQALTPAQIRAMGGGASQFTLSAGDPLASVTQFDYGFFAQDDWRIAPNLTLSGGLRYEAQTHVHDATDLGPRISLAWAPGAKKGSPSKNVIRAGFGIFYDRLAENLTLDAIRQNGIQQQRYLIRNPDFYPAVPTASSLASALQPQTIRETDAHWHPPTLVQMAASYERQLTKHVTVSTNFTHSAGSHQLRSRNINAPLPGTGLLPFGGVNAIYLYETSGIFRQNQLISSFNVKANSSLSFNGSYVYGRAMSNSDGAGTFPSNQYDLASEYARAGFDIRHRFQLNGSWNAKWGLRFSPFVTITSGRPYNITTGTDLNGDGLFTDRPSFASSGSLSGVTSTKYGLLDATPRPGETIIPRNLGEGPSLIAVNLRFSKAFSLGEPRKPKADPKQLVFSVNARNILNHPAYAPPDGNLSSLLFGQSTSLVNANNSAGNRRFDLQLRFNF